MAVVLIAAYSCERCSHCWLPRQGIEKNPELQKGVCPRCKSPYWNKPRKHSRSPEQMAAQRPNTEIIVKVA